MSEQKIIIIRDMTDEDIQDVLNIDRKIIGEERVVTYQESRDPGASTYLGGAMGLSKVAELNGQVIGFVIGRIVTHPYRINYTGFLSLVGVLPEFRHQGIAKRLVEAFIKSCKDKKIDRISTLVDLKDQSMLPFFKSLKFEQSQTVELFRNL